MADTAGLKVASEHEDDCVVTVDLRSERAKGLRGEIKTALLEEAKGAKSGVGKASVPDHVVFGVVPTNFKGAIRVPLLRQQMALVLKGREERRREGGSRGACCLKATATAAEGASRGPGVQATKGPASNAEHRSGGSPFLYCSAGAVAVALTAYAYYFLSQRQRKRK